MSLDAVQPQLWFNDKTVLLQFNSLVGLKLFEMGRSVTLQ